MTNPASEDIEELTRVSPRSFNRLAHFVTSELGIKMPESKIPLIQSRLLRRVRELGLASIDEYCERLFSSPDAESERVHFIDAITTNKTDFFREPQHFRLLTGKVLPVFAAERKITVWSAACSSG